MQSSAAVSQPSSSARTGPGMSVSWECASTWTVMDRNQGKVTLQEKTNLLLPGGLLERATRFELATLTLAKKRLFRHGSYVR